MYMAWSKGGNNMEISMSENDAMTRIFPDNAQRKLSKEFFHIQSKYNVLTSSTDTRHWQQNLSETHIQFNKKATNDILYITGDPSYMRQY